MGFGQYRSSMSDMVFILAGLKLTFSAREGWQGQINLEEIARKATDGPQ
jgi:hypothetical protein